MKCPKCGTVQFFAKTCKVCRLIFETGEIDYSKFKRMRGEKCPKCASDNVIEMPAWKRTNQAYPYPRECVDCHFEWNPPMQTGRRWFYIITGGFLTLFGIAGLIAGIIDGNIRQALGGGGLMIAFGLTALVAGSRNDTNAGEKKGVS